MPFLHVVVELSRLGVLENMRSTPADVAGRPRNCAAILARCGKPAGRPLAGSAGLSWSRAFHHASTSRSRLVSTGSECRILHEVVHHRYVYCRRAECRRHGHGKEGAGGTHLCGGSGSGSGDNGGLSGGGSSGGRAGGRLLVMLPCALERLHRCLHDPTNRLIGNRQLIASSRALTVTAY